MLFVRMKYAFIRNCRFRSIDHLKPCKIFCFFFFFFLSSSLGTYNTILVAYDVLTYPEVTWEIGTRDARNFEQGSLLFVDSIGSV